MEIKNLGKKVKHFKTKKGWITLQSGESAELPESVLESESKVEVINEKVTEVVPEKVLESESEGYSRDDLFKMNKKEQLKILESYGLSSKDIKKLKYEDMRVDKILELQGK